MQKIFSNVLCFIWLAALLYRLFFWGCFELAKSVGWIVDTLTHCRNRLWNVAIIFLFYIPIRTLILQLRKETAFKQCTGFLIYEDLSICRMEEIEEIEEIGRVAFKTITFDIFFSRVKLGTNIKRYLLKHHKLLFLGSDGHFLNAWTLFT